MLIYININVVVAVGAVYNVDKPESAEKWPLLRKNGGE